MFKLITPYKLTADEVAVLSALKESPSSFRLRSDFSPAAVEKLERNRCIDSLGPSIYLTYIGMMAILPDNYVIEE